jgi:hypothetical protein
MTETAAVHAPPAARGNALVRAGVITILPRIETQPGYSIRVELRAERDALVVAGTESRSTVMV